MLGPFDAVRAHPDRISASQQFPPGATVPVAVADGVGRLDLAPAHTGSADVDYARCSDGWYRRCSPATGLVVTVTWPVEIFPEMWIWTECHDPAGYPWWGMHDIVGIEPQSSAPMQNLDSDVAAGGALWVEAGETISAELCISVEDLAD